MARCMGCPEDGPAGPAVLDLHSEGLHLLGFPAGPVHPQLHTRDDVARHPGTGRRVRSTPLETRLLMMGLFSTGHRCADWSPTNVTPGARRAADRAMDRHVARHPKCTEADVCVHTGLILQTAYCTHCGRQI